MSGYSSTIDSKRCAKIQWVFAADRGLGGDLSYECGSGDTNQFPDGTRMEEQDAVRVYGVRFLSA